MFSMLLSQTGHAIQRNPEFAAGCCAFAVAAALFAGNALYGQAGGHPVPLWATRDMVSTRSVPARQDPDPVARTIAVNTLALEQIPIPIQRPPEKTAGPEERAALNVAQPQPVAPIQIDAPLPAANADRETIAKVQNALIALGYLDGEADGIHGPKTSAAIAAFQRDEGYPVDGKASRPLLLRSQAVLAKRKQGTDNQQVAKTPVPPQNTGDGGTSSNQAEAPATTVLDPEVQRSALVARVQIGLINFGVEDIAIDGVNGRRTREAIRTFQERYGMTPDGRASDELVEKMEAIGVLRKS